MTKTEKDMRPDTGVYWGVWKEIPRSKVLVPEGGRIPKKLVKGKDFFKTPDEALMDGGPSGEIGEGYPIRYIHQVERKSDPFPSNGWYDVGYFQDGDKWYPLVRNYEEEWFYHPSRGDVIITADGKAFVVVTP